VEELEERQADQVIDKEKRIEERQREAEAEDHDEDVHPAALGVVRAAPDDFLLVA
jgi:hypothetical protein